MTLEGLARGFKAAGLALSVAAASLGLSLCVNAIIMASSPPLESPALKAARERLEAGPDDEELLNDLRALDLIARGAFFTSRRLTDLLTLAFLAALGLALAAFKGRVLLLKRLADPNLVGAPPRDHRDLSGGIRIGLISGAALVALASFFVSRDVRADYRCLVNALGLGAYPSRARYQAEWPQLRGARAGLAEAEDAQPEAYRVAFRAQIDLPGNNSPVVWGKRVYLSGGNKDDQAVYAFDALNGRRLWKTSLASALGRRPYMPETDPAAGPCAPSVACDGQRVYAMFASGHLLALRAGDGKPLWHKDFGLPDNSYGIASSPVMSADLVIIQFDQADRSLLAAFQGSSGRLVWEAERDLEPSWASPIVVRRGSSERLIVVGNPAVEERDAGNGRLIWSLNCMRGETAPSAAYGEGRVYAVTALAGLVAISAEGRELWRGYDDLPDVASPLCAGARLYTVSSYGFLSCLDSASGSLLWSLDLGAEVNASPIMSGNRVFLPDMSGRLLWWEDSADTPELASMDLGGQFRASPAWASGRLYLRSPGELICLEGEK
jgi:outer membrane protein assembly factor BamB